MRLHEDRELFSDALQAASQSVEDGGLGIKSIQFLCQSISFSEIKLQSFLTEFLQKAGNENLIEDFDMQPFDVNVLDSRRTLTPMAIRKFRFLFGRKISNVRL